VERAASSCGGGNGTSAEWLCKKELLRGLHDYSARGLRFARTDWLVWFAQLVCPSLTVLRPQQDDLRDGFVKAAGLHPGNKAMNMTECYDERGALYEVPLYALRAPENLDGEPQCEEFKDAATAVLDAHAGTR
jgi:hypothetical protein